ncbi:MAG: DUF58 domain-containing protein [Alphaproteobacteria bacterium]
MANPIGVTPIGASPTGASPTGASPTGLQVRAEQLAARLPPLLVAAERVATTVSQGVHGRRRVGPGETFWQFRRYQPGDPISAIDWRQTAKRSHVYVRETEWAAAQTIWLWRDCSASMNYRSHLAATDKRARAELLALALASLLFRGGERVALLGAGAPISGRLALERLLLAMTEHRPDSGVPALAEVPRHGHVVLMGDFLDPIEDIAGAVHAFSARGAAGHILQILDPAEETLPFEGRVLLEGTENEGRLLVRRAEKMRARYIERLAAHRANLGALARGAGWSFGVHRTDHPPESALLALFNALTAPRRV